MGSVRPNARQECALPLGARLQRQHAGADVGGVQEDLAHRERSALRIEVLDRVGTGDERLAHVVELVEVGRAGLERHGDRQRLEDRAELEGAARQLVGVRRVEPVRRDASGRLRAARRRPAPRPSRHRARDRRRRMPSSATQACFSSSASACCTPMSSDIRTAGAGRAAGPLHGLDAAGLVEHALDAGDAPVVGVDGAQHVPGQRAQRIDALELGAEGEARQAQGMHALRLSRREAARHPGEAPAPVGQRLAQLGRVEARERGRRASRSPRRRPSTSCGSA